MSGLPAWLVVLQAQMGHDFSTMTSRHHVSAPTGPLEFALVAAGVLITLVVVFYCVKYFVRPQEQGGGHIKRQVLGDDF